MKCNFCGKENTEVTVHKFVPTSATDWIAYTTTLGQLKHKLCQSCNSRIFRKLKKDK